MIGTAQTISVAKLTYRVFEEKDLNGLLRLWEVHSGWGAITREQFQKWYLDTPYGTALIIVAVTDEDEIVGQLVFTPTRVVVNGREIKAYRGSAPILSPVCRQSSVNHADHPAFAMIRLGMEEGKKNGYKIVYTFPAQGWIGLFRTLPRYGLPNAHVALFDCFSISLEKNCPLQDSSILIKVLQGSFTQEYDVLWRDAITDFAISCGVMRDTSLLNWKLGGHLVFEARDTTTNKLLGYVAVNKRSGLIVDMLARTKEVLAKILLSLIHKLHHQNCEGFPLPFAQLTGMLTPSVQTVLQDIAYEKEEFSFAFGCYVFNDPTLKEELQPANWYMMPND